MKYLILFLSINALSSDPLKLIDRFRDLSKKFTEITHKDPSLIKDIAARRFINLPDWQKHLDSSKVADPTQVYSPKPQTWNHWQNTAYGIVKDQALSKEKLSFEIIQQWHKSALSGKLKEGINAGKLKVSLNYGANFLKSWALTNTQIENIKNFTFSDGKSTLEWTDLQCKEDLPITKGDISKSYDLMASNVQCQEIYETSLKHYKKDKLWAEAKESLEKNDLFMDDNPEWARWFWFACWPRAEVFKTSFLQKIKNLFKKTFNRSLASESKRCGMVHYPAPDKVKTLMKALVNKINVYFAQNSSKTSKHQLQKTVNDLQFAISIQRELAAIHPFQDGNGRMSRFLMDYVTIKLDLPFLFIPDMNNDYSADFQQYYKWTLDSIEETNNILSTCIEDYSNNPEEVRSSCDVLLEI